MCLSSVVQSLDWLACFSLLFPCAWRKKMGSGRRPEEDGIRTKGKRENASLRTSGDRENGRRLTDGEEEGKKEEKVGGG